MTENQRIIRIAAKGDGVTADGRHIAFSAPGDLVGPDGTLQHGEHHVVPPCHHFGTCGGCELQHVDEDALAQFVHDRVVFAAQSQGLEPALVQSPQMSPSHSRRRVKLLAVNGGGRPLIGFRQRGSHKLVDLRECHVMLPELFALVEPFRQYFKRVTGRFSVEIEMTQVDQGVAVTLSDFAPDGLQQIEELLEFCKAHQIARMTVDHGYGPEAFWEPNPVTVRLGAVDVPYPAGAFLQATASGEAALGKRSQRLVMRRPRCSRFVQWPWHFCICVSRRAQSAGGGSRQGSGARLQIGGSEGAHAGGGDAPRLVSKSAAR